MALGNQQPVVRRAEAIAGFGAKATLPRSAALKGRRGESKPRDRSCASTQPVRLSYGIIHTEQRGWAQKKKKKKKKGYPHQPHTTHCTSVLTHPLCSLARSCPRALPSSPGTFPPLVLSLSPRLTASTL